MINSQCKPAVEWSVPLTISIRCHVIFILISQRIIKWNVEGGGNWVNSGSWLISSAFLTASAAQVSKWAPHTLTNHAKSDTTKALTCHLSSWSTFGFTVREVHHVGLKLLLLLQSTPLVLIYWLYAGKSKDSIRPQVCKSLIWL